LPLIIAGYTAFCGISWLSRSVYPLFGLVVVMGIALPLAWGYLTGEWAAMGFSEFRWEKATAWGVGAGVVSGLLGMLAVEERAVAQRLLRQLLLGVPFWLLIISPFQEFFFRAWRQSGLAELWGARWGLLIATGCFTAWHYVSPIVDLATFPLRTPVGVLTTFAAGLAYGYAFLRSRSALAPWLGHAISGIVFVIAGAMDFVQALA
jgi:membrane protease YdiL (CAAX protease family)